MYTQYHNFDLSSLEREAYINDNKLALAIYDKLDEEVESRVKYALEKDDSAYSYGVFDAVHSCQFLLLHAEWEKDEKKSEGHYIVYKIRGVCADTHPFQNDVTLTKLKGSDKWTLEAKGGEYGEDVYKEHFYAGGYKKAQDQASHILMERIKRGFELNLYL